VVDRALNGKPRDGRTPHVSGGAGWSISDWQ
jgi:hypothetical protein